MLKLSLPISVGLLAAVIAFSIPTVAGANTSPTPACERSQAVMTLRDHNKHCRAVAAAPSVTLVTSPSSCTVQIEGQFLANFSYLSLDANMLLGPTYTSTALIVYPQDAQITDVMGTTTIVVTNQVLCGATLVQQSVLFADGTGVAGYDTVTVMA